MRPVERLDLPVQLQRSSKVALHHQLAEALRRGVLGGYLDSGQRLPSTRQAALELGVARATVLAAYEQLVGEGYLRARHGSGTHVAPHLGPAPSPAAAPGPPAPAVASPEQAGTGIAPALVELRPGRPDSTRVVDSAWRAAWRTAAAQVPSCEPPLQGLGILRAEVAAHLRAARGVAARPEDVFVTAGADEGLALIAHALHLTGASAPSPQAAGPLVAVEDPGYPSARRCLQRLGAALHPVPVDAQGMRVDLLPGGGPPGPEVRAVLVTPSHQYPLGGVLPLERRLELLAWAREHDALVVEDDYDGEFRYGAAPLPALAGLEPDRGVHLGTFSKVLTPWLRTGYVLVPPHLRPAFTAVREDLGTPVSGIQQQALATYLASGALRRHIARSRRDYGHRRVHLQRLLQTTPR